MFRQLFCKFNFTLIFLFDLLLFFLFFSCSLFRPSWLWNFRQWLRIFLLPNCNIFGNTAIFVKECAFLCDVWHFFVTEFSLSLDEGVSSKLNNGCYISDALDVFLDLYLIDLFDFQVSLLACQHQNVFEGCTRVNVFQFALETFLNSYLIDLVDFQVSLLACRRRLPL